MVAIRQNLNPLQVGDKVIHRDGSADTVKSINRDGTFVGVDKSGKAVTESLHAGDILLTLSGDHMGTVAQYKGHGKEKIYIDGHKPGDNRHALTPDRKCDDASVEFSSKAKYDSVWNRINKLLSPGQQNKLEPFTHAVEEAAFPNSGPSGLHI